MTKIFAAMVLASFAIMTSLIIMFMTGCGTETAKNMRSVFWDIPVEPDAFIDPYFEPLIAEYKADMAACGFDEGSFNDIVRIEFVEPKGKTLLLGICAVIQLDDGTYYRRIAIRGDTRGTDIEKPLFYHEMTHCVYGLDHDNIPGSIMYPELSGQYGYWDLTWTKQVKQLCGMIKAVRSSK